LKKSSRNLLLASEIFIEDPSTQLNGWIASSSGEKCVVTPSMGLAFGHCCALEDGTPYQEIKQFMRDYIEVKMGADWRKEVFKDEAPP
jgi:hypothetical protein